jgi:glutamate synthase domain-containing protein 2
MHEWLHRIDQHFPVRYFAWLLTAVGLLLALFTYVAYGVGGGWALLCLFLVGLGWRDSRQRRHSVLRNYPVIGHLRFLFEKIRPEMRQYFFEDDKDGLPFPRDKRAIVYQRAKGALDKRPFGTQYDVYQTNYEWLHHSVAPKEPSHEHFRVTIGGPGCTRPYAASVFNISAMSYGSLSANAVLHRGAKMGGFAHDTGEGGFTPYHREHGGDIISEIGSGYFSLSSTPSDFGLN